uniref:Carboxylic ester hydrolase n=1 Tax=Leptinotarsa decemlineata TaxID=7539 RepID=A0A0A7ENM2_LEPDE|nr:esterase [Leptinotarsa decemlineata]
MLLISVLLFFSSILFSRADDVLVTIPNGKIKGRKEYSLRGISFFAFQQIPFAKPPVGNLRFQDPQPVENWKGTLDASKNKQILCFQQSNMYKIANMSAVEYEDCLYLNVYTPLNPSSNANLPVLFYIYGGGFVNGASDFDFFGPHYLMESGVIVVTANYRVGAFGFLSTGDTVLPGNYGLKDQLLALEWVKNNIRYFGGDPAKVTIFGQSAGAASVSFHLMSKKSVGLFRAAIAQSGSIISPWAYQRDYKQIAYDVASSLDRNFNRSSDSMQLLTFLRRASAADLNKAANDFKQNTGNEQIIQGFRFTPVVEPDHENAFITEMMYPAIEKGHMNRVPLMMGICSEEAIARAAVANFQSSVVSYENDLSRLVNKNMHLVDANEKKTAGEAIRKIYTNGLLQNDLGKAVRYFSDMSFNRAVIRHAEMQSNYSDVYFYQFSYHGPLGGNRPYLEGAYRVGHAEDNHYLWAYSNHTFLNKYSAEDITASNRFRTLFTNFAKYLNPTPKSEPLFENIIWPKVKPHDFQYLDINETLTIMRNPKGDVYPKWVDLYEKMAVKPFDTY